MAVTAGDPQGVGPEVIRKAFSGYRPSCAFVVVGHGEYFPDFPVPVVADLSEVDGPGVYFYRYPAIGPGEDPSSRYVQTAMDWAREEKIQGMVTAPISKEKWHRAGVVHSGHTGRLAHGAGVDQYGMSFWSDDLKVVLYTTHIPLCDVFRHLEHDRIVDFIGFTDEALRRLFGRSFTFLVSGINPHAGENGFMGREETDIIEPALETLRRDHGVMVEGPYPPDTIFLTARERTDCVVFSWYHDQGLIAFKLLNFHCGVNLTLGLPYVRTSPDHGTAYNIAGQGIADASSMTAALRLAEELVLRKIQT